VPHRTEDGFAEPRVIGMLRRAVEMAKLAVKGEPVNGRRWRRPKRECPPWCAQNHTCTARSGYPSGEHRSPITTRTHRWGRSTATRVQHVEGRAWLSSNISVELSSDPLLAAAQAGFVHLAVEHAVSATLGELEEAAIRVACVAGAALPPGRSA